MKTRLDGDPDRANSSNGLGGKYLTVEECSSFLRRPTKTIRKWCHERRIPFLKMGSARNAPVLFRLDDIEAWLTAFRLDPAEPPGPMDIARR